MRKPKKETVPGEKRRRPGYNRALYITDRKDNDFLDMLAEKEDRSVSSVIRRFVRQARLAFEASEPQN